VQVDGHSVSDIYEALTSSTQHKPKVIIARTIKGKGVSEMEGKLEWHYRSPTDQQLNSFIQEIKNNA
jgi:transketolase